MTGDRNSFDLLVNVVNSFMHVGFVNGLSKNQYKALGEALTYIQRVQNMREKKDDHPFIAQSLKDKGHTIREIAEILGYKHPGSVSHLLIKANQLP